MVGSSRSLLELEAAQTHAMSQQQPNEVVRFGDSISLFDDMSGSQAVARGLAGAREIHVGVVAPQPGKPSTGVFANTAVFTIWHQLTVTASLELQREHDNDAEGGGRRSSSRSTNVRPSLSGRSSTAGGKARLLQQDAEREAQRNREEFEICKGRELTYGATITLRHEGSGQFLAVSERASETDRDARKVVLSSTLGEEMCAFASRPTTAPPQPPLCTQPPCTQPPPDRCRGLASWALRRYFRVMPLLERVHFEGDRVYEASPPLLILPWPPSHPPSAFLSPSRFTLAWFPLPG